MEKPVETLALVEKMPKAVSQINVGLEAGSKRQSFQEEHGSTLRNLQVRFVDILNAFMGNVVGVLTSGLIDCQDRCA